MSEASHSIRKSLTAPNPSIADVAGGRITLRTPFANLIFCQRIPNAIWDSARHIWTYPCTQRHARLVRASIPEVRGTDAFNALLAAQPAPQPHPSPVPEPRPAIILPASLRTRPWRHQIEAYEFAMERLQSSGACLLAMEMGCVAGDAELVINRGGGARRITLRQLQSKFHGGLSRGRAWNLETPTLTRSLIDGELRLNRIVDVMATGVKPVVRLRLASGRSVVVTPDHRIACPDGLWIPAGDLQPGDAVLTNGTPVCRACGGTDRVATYRYAKHRGICRKCVGRRSRRVASIVDKDGYVRLYGMHQHPRANVAGQVYEHIVVMERLLGRPITREEHIHHRNGIRSDNRPENLELLDPREHHARHGRSGGYLHFDGDSLHFLPKLDRVVSQEPAGETDVYDIEMAAPGHNFVADGVLVHNCGKTLAALAALAGLNAQRVLIGCPLRVVPVWAKQIQLHLKLPTITIALDDRVSSVAAKQKLAEEKSRLAAATGRPLVVVINYDSLWRAPFADWAEKQKWDLIIADESHRLKAPGGKASLAFKRLRTRAQARLALTGTPLPHSPLDAYAQFRFLDPKIFGPSFAAFRQKYAVMGGFQKKQVTGYQHLDELEALMGRITYRVRKDVLDLPEATHVTYECTLGAEARRVYRDLEEDFVTLVANGQVTAANALVKLLRLQQVAGGWVKTDDGQLLRVDTAKQKLLADTLEDIGPDEPVVAFCRFHGDLDAVHEAAAANGQTSVELSGRRDELKAWQDGGAQILAVQISAGGVGIDLTRARYSIYYSLSFSLGEYDQALSRVHRPGQTRPVEHLHLIARDTVDTRIMRALEKRAEVVQSILDEIQHAHRKGKATCR